jgi:hypothetical protein
MNGRLSVMSAMILIVAVSFSVSFGGAAYQVKVTHPWLFIEDVQELAQRCDGPLADDNEIAKPLTTTIKTETQYQ